MNNEIEWEHEDAAERQTGNVAKNTDGRVYLWINNHEKDDTYMEHDQAASVEIQRPEAAEIIMFLENAFQPKHYAVVRGADEEIEPGAC